jgi:hypothetical protein
MESVDSTYQTIRAIIQKATTWISLDNQDFTEPSNINLLSTAVDCCGHCIVELYILEKKRWHVPSINHNKENTSATKKFKRWHINNSSFMKYKLLSLYLWRLLIFHGYEFQKEVFFKHVFHKVQVVQNFYTKISQDILQVICWTHPFWFNFDNENTILKLCISLK